MSIVCCETKELFIAILYFQQWAGADICAGFPPWLCHCLAKGLFGKDLRQPMGLNSCQESSFPQTCPLPELICCLDLHTIQQFSCAGSSAKLNILCLTIRCEKY